MKRNKVTNAEMIERVNTVFDLLTIGSTRQQILQFVASKTNWNVCDRTVDIYIARANERFEENAQFYRARELGKALSRLNTLYQKTLQVQDYARCLAVQRELNQLLGLYEPKQIEINVNIEVVTRAWQALEKAGKNPEAVFNRLAEQAERVQ